MTILRLAVLLAVSFSATSMALAHGDGHRCKKGYVMTDEHKCVKAPK